MLRTLLKAVSLALVLSAGSALAKDDRADPYPGFTRLTDNYSIGSRKQNYDEYEFPVSINKTVKVEGQKIQLEYNYEKSDVVASQLQYKRHFEGIATALGGELLHSGKTDKHANAVTFKFPKGGKTAWALVSTGDWRELYHYKVTIVETSQPWGGAPAPAAAEAPAPKPAPAPKAEPKPEPVAAPEPAGPWEGGDWVEVRFGGCDVPNARRSKSAVPDADYCDAKLNGKVAVCNAEFGCLYKNVTPKQCKDGSQTGRMYVCTPR